MSDIKIRNSIEPGILKRNIKNQEKQRITLRLYGRYYRNWTENPGINTEPKRATRTSSPKQGVTGVQGS
jgi:hypothetical protein